MELFLLTFKRYTKLKKYKVISQTIFRFSLCSVYHKVIARNWWFAASVFVAILL